MNTELSLNFLHSSSFSQCWDSVQLWTADSAVCPISDFLVYTTEIIVCGSSCLKVHQIRNKSLTTRIAHDCIILILNCLLVTRAKCWSLTRKGHLYESPQTAPKRRTNLHLNEGVSRESIKFVCEPWVNDYKQERFQTTLSTKKKVKKRPRSHQGQAQQSLYHVFCSSSWPPGVNQPHPTPKKIGLSNQHKLNTAWIFFFVFFQSVPAVKHLVAQPSVNELKSVSAEIDLFRSFGIYICSNRWAFYSSWQLYI